MTADQMRAFGMDALTHGYADQALSIAEALLERDPRDSSAWTLKAQALRLRGDLPGSAQAARRAWAVADGAAARYAAATAMAQALSLQDHRTRAQYWLRQAVQNAPNRSAQTQALQDYAYVRDQNPLSLQFDGSFRPSNNVNGGARDPLFEFQGIPFILSGDALALSGFSYGLGLTGSYKLTETVTTQNALTFAVSQQGVILSKNAQLQAPKAQNGDYAVGHVETGWQHKATQPFGQWTTEVTAGHSWYGGRDLSDSLAARVELDRTVAPGVSGTFAASLTGQTRLDRPAASSTEVELEATLGKAGPKGDHWQWGLSLSRVNSDDMGIDHGEATLSLGWQAADPVAGLGLGAILLARVADYDASPYTTNGRHDLRLAGSLTATVQAITYLGFSPVISLDIARIDSNVSLFDTQTIGLSLSIKSRF